MTKIGIVSNPRSERSQGGIAEIRAFAAGRADVTHREPASLAQLSETLSDFAKAGVGLLVIHGGDGTVQTVLTALLAGKAFATPPLVAILPGGMTNLIAVDVGLTGTPTEALKRLTGAADLRAHVVNRPIIRLDGIGDGPVYGMFLATAAIVRATELNRDSLHRFGIRDPLAIALIVITLLCKYVLRGGRPNAFFRGDPIGIRFDGASEMKGDRFLLLVSTLEKLVFGLHPYWGTGPGAMHLTAVDFPPKRLPGVLFSLLRKRVPKDLPANYLSRNADRIVLDMVCPLTLDGEMIRPEGRPIELSAAETLDFVRL